MDANSLIPLPLGATLLLWSAEAKEVARLSAKSELKVSSPLPDAECGFKLSMDFFSSSIFFAISSDVSPELMPWFSSSSLMCSNRTRPPGIVGIKPLIFSGMDNKA